MSRLALSLLLTPMMLAGLFCAGLAVYLVGGPGRPVAGVIERCEDVPGKAAAIERIAIVRGADASERRVRVPERFCHEDRIGAHLEQERFGGVLRSDALVEPTHGKGFFLTLVALLAIALFFLGVPIAVLRSTRAPAPR